jgi:hypothetical protein
VISEQGAGRQSVGCRQAISTGHAVKGAVEQTINVNEHECFFSGHDTILSYVFQKHNGGNGNQGENIGSHRIHV